MECSALQSDHHFIRNNTNISHKRLESFQHLNSRTNLHYHFSVPFKQRCNKWECSSHGTWLSHCPGFSPHQVRESCTFSWRIIHLFPNPLDKKALKPITIRLESSFHRAAIGLSNPSATTAHDLPIFDLLCNHVLLWCHSSINYYQAV